MIINRKTNYLGDEKIPNKMKSDRNTINA